MIFQIIGAIGLLLISVGVLGTDRRKQNYLYVLGGVSLEVYSVYLQDPIFIILQVVFIGAALYDLFKHKPINVS